MSGSITNYLLTSSTDLGIKPVDTYANSTLKLVAGRIASSMTIAIGLVESATFSALSLATSPLYLLSTNYYKAYSEASYERAVDAYQGTMEAATRFFYVWDVNADDSKARLPAAEIKQPSAMDQLKGYASKALAIPRTYPKTTAVLVAVAISATAAYQFGLFDQLYSSLFSTSNTPPKPQPTTDLPPEPRPNPEQPTSDNFRKHFFGPMPKPNTNSTIHLNPDDNPLNRAGNHDDIPFGTGGYAGNSPRDSGMKSFDEFFGWDENFNLDPIYTAWNKVKEFFSIPTSHPVDPQLLFHGTKVELPANQTTGLDKLAQNASGRTAAQELLQGFPLDPHFDVVANASNTSVTPSGAFTPKLPSYAEFQKSMSSFTELMKRATAISTNDIPTDLATKWTPQTPVALLTDGTTKGPDYQSIFRKVIKPSSDLLNYIAQLQRSQAATQA